MALSIYYLIILILRHISRPGLKTLSPLTQKVYSKIKFFLNFNKKHKKTHNREKSLHGEKVNPEKNQCQISDRNEQMYILFIQAS